MKHVIFRFIGVILLAVLGFFAWQYFDSDTQDATVISGNGRIEAVEIDVAVKTAGRLKDVLVHEGEFITTGQVLALMDTQSLEAQRQQAEAQLQQAKYAVASSRSQLVQRESEKVAAMAMVSQRQAELIAARKRANRIIELATKGVSSQQEVDDMTAAVDSARAALSAARAQVSASDAAIATAHKQVDVSLSAVEAASAAVARTQSDLDDSTLKAPRDGRVQYIVARPGEVIGAGGRVLNMVDLKDVYMTFFLPTRAVGQVALGSEVHLVLDAAPQYVIPANVSFIADVAQFTPKTVQTEIEREKLMFRVRAQIPTELLEKHLLQVKTGLPGMAYLRLDPEVPWPSHLEARLPE